MDIRSLLNGAKFPFCISHLKMRLKFRQSDEVPLFQWKIPVAQNFSTGLSTETVHMFILAARADSGQPGEESAGHANE